MPPFGEPLEDAAKRVLSELPTRYDLPAPGCTPRPDVGVLVAVRVFPEPCIQDRSDLLRYTGFDDCVTFESRFLRVIRDDADDLPECVSDHVLATNLRLLVDGPPSVGQLDVQ